MSMRLHGIQTLLSLAAFTIAVTTHAADDDQADRIKEMKGISIKADKEAPRALYIVPWHDAEHKQNTRLSSSLVDDSLQAIDQRALQQRLRLQELSTSGWHRLTPDAR
jgi:hypothetical protein